MMTMTGKSLQMRKIMEVILEELLCIDFQNGTQCWEMVYICKERV